MEPKKYWWVSYFVQYWDSAANRYEDRVQDVHPFYCKRSYEIIDDKSRKIYTLHDWKIISEEEYELWNQLNNK